MNSPSELPGGKFDQSDNRLTANPAFRLLSTVATAGEKFMNAVCKVQGVIASAAVAFLVTLLVSGSLGRYLFNAPIAITEELGALLFITLGMLALTEGFVEDRQARIQIVWRLLPRHFRGWAIIVGHGLSIIILAVCVGETFKFAYFSFEVNSKTYIADILLWPWMMLIPFSLGMLALATLVRMLVDLRAVLLGKPVKEELNSAIEFDS